MFRKSLKLNELKGLTAEDPRREHLKECPRCQAVLRSFADLAEVADVPGCEEVVDAHARLMMAVYTVYENKDQSNILQ